MAPSTDVQNQASPAAAALALKAKIAEFVKLVNFPSGLAAEKATIAEAIIQKLDAASFNIHNRDERVVEAHAIFTAKTKPATGTGTKIFELKIVWDADLPPVGSTQLPHYGWEIYLASGTASSTRVYGPGHIFFTPGTPVPHYRRPGAQQAELVGLKLDKTVALGSGTLQCVTQYYKLV